MAYNTTHKDYGENTSGPQFSGVCPIKNESREFVLSPNDRRKTRFNLDLLARQIGFDQIDFDPYNPGEIDWDGTVENSFSIFARIKNTFYSGIVGTPYGYGKIGYAIWLTNEPNQRWINVVKADSFEEASLIYWYCRTNKKVEDYMMRHDQFLQRMNNAQETLAGLASKLGRDLEGLDKQMRSLRQDG